MKLGIVGFGEIARREHVPAIAATPGLELIAVASPDGGAAGLPLYPDIATLLAREPGLDAVALCQPPRARHAAAAAAIAAGKHVLLEKPPAATLSEVEDLRAQAAARGVTLFASWHSRFAPGVAAAKAWLAGRRIASASIVWREDVRKFHGGQTWIWEEGGLGVFDAGINALSILTEIWPGMVRLEDAVLEVPANRAMPIAARLALRDDSGAVIAAEFDWRQAGPPIWDIVVEADGGRLVLAEGGKTLTIAGVAQALEGGGEYPSLYRRFAELVAAGTRDVDVAPFRLVADSLLRGERRVTDRFD